MPFGDVFLPALTGELAQGGAGAMQGMVQGEQLSRQLAQQDLERKVMQFKYEMDQRKAQQPSAAQFHNLGSGAFAVVNPATGLPMQVNRPPQDVPPEMQLMRAFSDPEMRPQVEAYLQARHPIKPEAPQKFSPTDQVLNKVAATGVDSLSTGERAIWNMYQQQHTPAPKGTPGQNAVDSAFAKDYAEFVAAGGYADVEKQLGQLRGAAKSLETDSSLTGPFVGLVPDAIRNITNPESVAVRDQVMEVVQRNLRMILGPQFTEREGMLLMRRAYNEQQSPAENKKRVERLIKQIQSAAQAKANAGAYFEQHGTLQGWKGKLPSLSDFNPDVPSLGEGRKPLSKSTPSAQTGRVPRRTVPLRITTEEAYNQLSKGAAYIGTDGISRVKQ